MPLRGSGSQIAGTMVSISPDWRYPATGIFTAIAEQSGVSLRAVYDAIKGKEVNMDAAKGISAVLGLALDKAFAIQEESRSLSTKTVLEHHRLISTVLDQAEKEGLVPFNVASKATAG